MSKLYAGIIGWLGTILVLGGYFMLSLGVFSNDWPYHTCMFVGSFCLAIVAYRVRLWEVVTLNVCFTLFALIALIRIVIL